MKALAEQLKHLWSDEKRRVNLLVAMGTLGIALLAVFLDDGVRYLAFGEAIGPYCLF